MYASIPADHIMFNLKKFIKDLLSPVRDLTLDWQVFLF